jgi:hypothetical protein
MLHSAELESPRLTPSWKDSGVFEGLLAIASLIMLVVVTMLIVAVWKMIPPAPPKPGWHALGHTVLADGSTVRVVAISVGNYPKAEYTFPPTNHWEGYWGIERSVFLNFGHVDDAIVIWLVRHRSGSTITERFDSLRHATLEWGNNPTVQEMLVEQHSAGLDGQIGRLGRSPHEYPPPGPQDIVFTFLHFPLIHDPGCPVTLRLLDENAEELGSLKLTLPAAELRWALR